MFLLNKPALSARKSYVNITFGWSSANFEQQYKFGSNIPTTQFMKVGPGFFSLPQWIVYTNGHLWDHFVVPL